MPVLNWLFIDDCSGHRDRAARTTRRPKLESISEALVQACTHGILGQCSKDILNAASKKLIDFVKTRLLEPKVAGQLVGCLVRVFSRIHGREVMRGLLPYVVQTIERYMEDHEDTAEMEKRRNAVLPVAVDQYDAR